MKYIIYKHTIKNTNKSYIGFTSQTMEKRLHKHLLNANSGIKTKFYNAINKYGSESIISEILDRCESEKEAIEKEAFYIEKYDTYKSGYNSTKIGGGGWIIGQLSEDKQKAYFEKRIELNTGKKNPNYSGFTDEEIVIAGSKCYLENNNIFSIRKWYIYCDKFGYPKTFSKCRFNGESYNGFKKAIADYLGIDKLNKYVKTKEHIKKLSEKNKNKCWITNGIDTLNINISDFEKYDSSWKRGRTIKNN